jgi:hypothetical protein
MLVDHVKRMKLLNIVAKNKRMEQELGRMLKWTQLKDKLGSHSPLMKIHVDQVDSKSLNP